MKRFLSILMLVVALGGECLGQSHSVQVACSPVVTASSAYSSGNVVGGIDSFLVFSRSSGSGVLASCLLIDRANQKQPMTVLFYSKRPSHGTYTDKASFAFDSTDAVNLVRQVTIAATDYTTSGAYAAADVSAIGKVITNTETSTKLYAIIVTTGTPTFNATTNVTLKVGVLQD